MESLDNLNNRIDHYRTESNYEKFVWGIEPALIIGMRDFLEKSQNEKVNSFEFQDLNKNLLIAYIKEEELIDEEQIDDIEKTLKAVEQVRSLKTARKLNEKYGTIPELVEQREALLAEADEYLERTERLLQTMRDNL